MGCLGNKLVNSVSNTTIVRDLMSSAKFLTTISSKIEYLPVCVEINVKKHGGWQAAASTFFILLVSTIGCTTVTVMEASPSKSVHHAQFEE